MKYVTIAEATPPSARRVLVKTTSGRVFVGKYVRRWGSTDMHFIDDYGVPIRGVVSWADSISDDETGK